MPPDIESAVELSVLSRFMILIGPELAPRPIGEEVLGVTCNLAAPS